ncbi:MAG: hypothetical protein H6Q26_983 [Bacteroidetes bacterium]|nr:hypothetical protein [Bacteroidota bacterium]
MLGVFCLYCKDMGYVTWCRQGNFPLFQTKPYASATVAGTRL